MDKITVYYQKRKKDYKPYFVWLRKKQQGKFIRFCVLFLCVCAAYAVFRLIFFPFFSRIFFQSITHSSNLATICRLLMLCGPLIYFIILHYVAVNIDWKTALHSGIGIKTATFTSEKVVFAFLVRGKIYESTIPYSLIESVNFDKKGIYLSIDITDIPKETFLPSCLSSIGPFICPKNILLPKNIIPCIPGFCTFLSNKAAIAPAI